jgi:hypothetical protein
MRRMSFPREDLEPPEALREFWEECERYFQKFTRNPLQERAGKIKWSRVIQWIGVMATVVLSLEPNKTVQITVGLLALMLVGASGAVYELLPAIRRYRVILSIFFALPFVGLYGWHVWPTIRYEPYQLHQMSTEELKKAEKILAEELRNYQSTFDTKLIATQSGKDLLKLSMDFSSVFDKQYRDKACAVRDEILWRVKKTPAEVDQDIEKSYDAFPPVFRMHAPLSRALSGVIAGPHPVRDAADYLDALTRYL